MSRRGEVLTKIGDLRVSAIVRAREQETARQAMEAAVVGGFRMVEFTLTTPGALELVAEFAGRETLLVGAGTVLTRRQARDAVEAGAQFLVSPVVDEEVIEEAGMLDVVSIPGAMTPTEMMAADAAGAEIVKIFPAPTDLRLFVTQVRGPLPHLKLFPTAGVSESNFEAVLEAGAFGVGFVASLFDPTDLAQGRYEEIAKRARRIIDRLGAKA